MEKFIGIVIYGFGLAVLVTMIFAEGSSFIS